MPSRMNLTPDQLTWLTANKDGYELILLHSILHDKMRRTSMLGVPLFPTDFGAPELGAIWQGVVMAARVMELMDSDMPYPPDVETLQYYMIAATREKGALVLDEDLEGGYKLLAELQSPTRQDQWYFLDTYFTAWLTSVRAKGYARRAQMSLIADAGEMAALIQTDIRKANTAIFTQESDDMYQALYGTSEIGKIRRPSGFPALDEATGGGWGEGECYGLFAPTGGGKTVCAAQVAYYNALTGGDTLVLSTEVPVVEYITRMLSNACNIKINLIKDCLNVSQVKAAVAAQDPVNLPKVDLALVNIVKRIRVVKLHPDQGLNARAIMEREVMLYEQQMGRPPTLIIFDWLGRVADVGGNKSGGSSDRTVAWEAAADSCVQFCEVSGIPALILLQATNTSGNKRVLTQEDIGISKGVIKQFVMAFGIAACVDQAAVKQALLTGTLGGTMHSVPDDQLFCVVKSRKGEALYIPVRRNFVYQRFVSGKNY